MAGDDQILLVFDAKQGQWARLPVKQALAAGERLLALPTYRDELAFGENITLQLVGGTQVLLLPAEGKSPAGVQIDFGRLVLAPAQAGPQLRLAVGGHAGVLTLADAETIAAVEVISQLAAGGESRA